MLTCSVRQQQRYWPTDNSSWSVLFPNDRICFDLATKTSRVLMKRSKEKVRTLHVWFHQWTCDRFYRDLRNEVYPASSVYLCWQRAVWLDSFAYCPLLLLTESRGNRVHLWICLSLSWLNQLREKKKKKALMTRRAHGHTSSRSYCLGSLSLSLSFVFGLLVRLAICIKNDWSIRASIVLSMLHKCAAEKLKA